MFKLLKYKIPDVKYVKFQRIIMGWLAIAALFTQDINLVLVFYYESEVEYERSFRTIFSTCCGR